MSSSFRVILREWTEIMLSDDISLQSSIQSAQLSPLAVADRKLVAGIRRKQSCDEAGSVGQGLRSQPCVLPFPQLRVVEVNRERKLVYRQSIGEGRFKVVRLCLLVDARLAV